jgi:hypothetical protein
VFCGVDGNGGRSPRILRLLVHEDPKVGYTGIGISNAEVIAMKPNAAWNDRGI